MGDARLKGAYQLNEDGPVYTTLAIHVKIPTSSLPTAFETIPLGDGQWDLALEQTTTWALTPGVHADLRLLFRHRFPFEDGERILKPGEEF